MPQMPKEGTWTIGMGQGNTIGIIKPLIPFNCIVDIDVGLINLIKTDYRSPDMFNIGLLDSLMNKKQIIQFMHDRSTINPLVPFMVNQEDTETADDLYIQFMSKEYENILRKSSITGLYKLLGFCNVSEEIAPMLTYSNDIEALAISQDELLKKIKLVNIKDIKNECASMNVFFFRSVEDPYFIASGPVLKTKNITILDYKYNFDADGDLLITDQTALADMNRCVFNVISAYSKEEIG